MAFCGGRARCLKKEKSFFKYDERKKRSTNLKKRLRIGAIARTARDELLAAKWFTFELEEDRTWDAVASQRDKEAKFVAHKKAWA